MFSSDKTRADGLHPYCKSCQKKRMDIYYAAHREKLIAYQKEYHKKYAEKCKAYRRRVSKQRGAYMCEWRKKNWDKIMIYKKKYHKEVESKQIEYRILHSLRGRLLQALNGTVKSKHTMEFVGCDMIQLKEHLSSQFKKGMAWDNYGRKGWHIDHITPCSSFNLTCPNEQKKCFHYTNLQPLWWLDNCRKNKY
jgi:hypothetical protein